LKGRFDPDRYHRQSHRLQNWDYTSEAVYFVTLCTYQREPLFDEPRFREIAERQWRAIPGHPHARRVSLDEWVVMPDHVHGLLVLGPRAAGERFGPPARRGEPAGVPPGSLGAIVGNYKAVVTRQINRLRDTPHAPVWLRNYYERIVRDQEELEACRRYITNNPARWAADHDDLDALLPRMTIR
jgi:putative transposase